MQFSFVFVFTSILAKLAVKLHGGSKKIISLSLGFKKGSGWSGRTNGLWKLAMYIEAFHTDNLNTVTFGKVAKITYQSVAKV